MHHLHEEKKKKIRKQNFSPSNYHLLIRWFNDHHRVHRSSYRAELKATNENEEEWIERKVSAEWKGWKHFFPLLLSPINRATSNYCRERRKRGWGWEWGGGLWVQWARVRCCFFFPARLWSPSLWKKKKKRLKKKKEEKRKIRDGVKASFTLKGRETTVGCTGWWKRNDESTFFMHTLLYPTPSLSSTYTNRCT